MNQLAADQFLRLNPLSRGGQEVVKIFASIMSMAGENNENEYLWVAHDICISYIEHANLSNLSNAEEKRERHVEFGSQSFESPYPGGD